MNLLFDLDGTLTDSRPGIVNCIRSTLRALGIEQPSEEALTRYIGPPTHHAFRELLGSSDPSLVDRAVAMYRERFVEIGMFDNSVYPGVREGLEALTGAGHRLWVATSKPRIYADPIIDHFSLRRFFVGVFGSELDGVRGEKADLIGYLLASEHLPAAGSWMIGDRVHDVVGAHRNGVRAAGVLWGYGTRAELEAAGADVTFASMADLVEALGARAGRPAPPARLDRGPSGA
jgi:phosphoglycolate phosphatase